MDLKGEIHVIRGDGTLKIKQTMEFPNLNNEEAGQLKEYMDACEKDLAKAAQKPRPGTYSVKLIANIDGVGASEHIGEGLAYKDAMQFLRKMWHHQDKLLKYGEEDAAKAPPTP